MSTHRFLGSELAERDAATCQFHVLPVPYEATVSYGGGTAEGPAAIVEASQQLEVWTGRRTPSENGIFTWPAVSCSGSAEEVLGRIEEAVNVILAAGPQGTVTAAATPCCGKTSLTDEAAAICHAMPTLPIILGGEHTVTLGVLRALKKRYGHFGVVQFDAHADLRDSYEGSPYSHACVMRRAVDDLGLALFQVGVRSVSPEEVLCRQEQRIPHLDARTLCCPLPWATGQPDADAQPASIHGVLQRQTPSHIQLQPASILPKDFPGLIFLTFDLDAFDASLMPATGTPEPGGLFWWDALHLVERCLTGRTALGFDIVELAPIPGLHAPNYTAARLTHEIMGLFGK